MKTLLVGSLIALLLADGLTAGENVAARHASAYAGRGYELLTTKPYLPPDFDQQTFDELWKTWEEPVRSQAEKATPQERTRMAYSRYGLTVAPGDASLKPQQYIVDKAGNWTMTCLTCHQGKVAGKVMPGVPNSLLALQTLVEEVRTTKLRLGKPLGSMDLGSAFIPLGTSNGTTNAVIFGVALMANRDAELNVLPSLHPAKMVHHDHDAPPWWNFKKKQRLYSDGFAVKSVRPLMQFMLIPENGPEKFHEWEADFGEIYAWLESLEPPAYPFAVDRPLARQGEAIFNQNCADCHGRYGAEPSYPNKIVSIEEVGTDPVRLSALSAKHRAAYGDSWFGHFGEHKTIDDPGGYVAPPLDGIWASAPYFHNGSVPTLWHVLHPSERPVVWQRTEDGYDESKVGLEVTRFERLPQEVTSGRDRRRYFDTTKSGKSAAGHDFPDALDEAEKRAVLEYLKTL
ncbi:MAG TPA: c-type cytochrome [Pirellulales bacterium]|nr:c-type cytochrome [Pirellulales bacterium]